MYKYNHLLSHHNSYICNHNAFIDGIVCVVKHIYIYIPDMRDSIVTNSKTFFAIC